jgi:RNA polymerase sigma-70 factor, ECF subfamily
VSPTDESLVVAIGSGDAAALETLMARHAPRLLRFAAHYLRSAADADEVLQDVWIRADRAFRRGSRPERVDAWLFRVAVNRCRSRRRRWWPFLSGPAADAIIDRTASTDVSGGAAWREEIQQAIAQLSAPLREAFLLKHVEGMEYNEMTVITGASVPALKMRVARACDQLREQLREVRHD